MDNIYVKKNHNKGKIISNEIINFKITLFEKKNITTIQIYTALVQTNFILSILYKDGVKKWFGTMIKTCENVMVLLLNILRSKEILC